MKTTPVTQIVLTPLRPSSNPPEADKRDSAEKNPLQQVATFPPGAADGKRMTSPPGRTESIFKQFKARYVKGPLGSIRKKSTAAMTTIRTATGTISVNELGSPRHDNDELSSLTAPDFPFNQRLKSPTEEAVPASSGQHSPVSAKKIEAAQSPVEKDETSSSRRATPLASPTPVPRKKESADEMLRSLQKVEVPVADGDKYDDQELADEMADWLEEWVRSPTESANSNPSTHGRSKSDPTLIFNSSTQRRPSIERVAQAHSNPNTPLRDGSVPLSKFSTQRHPLILGDRKLPVSKFSTQQPSQPDSAAQETPEDHENPGRQQPLQKELVPRPASPPVVNESEQDPLEWMKEVDAELAEDSSDEGDNENYTTSDNSSSTTRAIVASNAGPASPLSPNREFDASQLTQRQLNELNQAIREHIPSERRINNLLRTLYEEEMKTNRI